MDASAPIVRDEVLRFGPQAQLTALLDNWSDYYIARTKAAIDGTWREESVWQGLKEGVVQLAPYGPGVDDATRTGDAARGPCRERPDHPGRAGP